MRLRPSHEASSGQPVSSLTDSSNSGRITGETKVKTADATVYVAALRVGNDFADLRSLRKICAKKKGLATNTRAEGRLEREA
jgi:hypothetical protein